MRLFDPVAEFNVLRREIDRVFESFRNSPANPLRPGRTYPLVNVSEDADVVTVEALAPGLRAESISVSVQRNQLTLSGEKPGLGDDVKRDQIYRNERGFGRFSRTLTLPSEVDANKVTAEYRNGLLTVTLPKSEAAKPRRIDVSVS
jgi:HSP20 family protein